jgi:molecular chaperone GrpE (heat shock protein)
MKKFTNLEDDLIKENAELAKEFNENYKSALRKLDIIKIALDDYAIKQVKDPRSWGYVGSLEHINEELNDIMEFLGIKEIIDNQEKYNV